MSIDDFPLHPRARTAFQALSEAEQSLVLQELTRWWNLPRNQWPADRLISHKHQADVSVFVLYDNCGVQVQWHGEKAAEITSLMRRNIEIAPKAQERPPLLRDPAFLLFAGALVWIIGLLTMIGTLVAIAEQRPGDPVSFSDQMWLAVCWLALFFGTVAFIRGWWYLGRL
jgi:hypothetical protein